MARNLTQYLVESALPFFKHATKRQSHHADLGLYSLRGGTRTHTFPLVRGVLYPLSYTSINKRQIQYTYPSQSKKNLPQLSTTVQPSNTQYVDS